MDKYEIKFISKATGVPVARAMLGDTHVQVEGSNPEDGMIVKCVKDLQPGDNISISSLLGGPITDITVIYGAASDKDSGDIPQKPLPESSEPMESDDDEDILIPDGSEQVHAEVISEDSAICTDDSDDDDGEEESEDEELSDREFWAKYRNISEDDDDDAVDSKNLDILSQSEMTPEIAANVLKIMSKNFAYCADLSKKLKHKVLNDRQLLADDSVYRAMQNLCGQIMVSMSMFHLTGDTILTADNLHLFNAGVAEMQSTIIMIQAACASAEALKDSKHYIDVAKASRKSKKHKNPVHAHPGTRNSSWKKGGR